jgi:hypothetical protein
MQLMNNIPPLPPGKEIRHAFAFTIKYFNAMPQLPLQYSVRITFNGGTEKVDKIVDQIISLNFFEGSRLNRLEENSRK